MNKEFRHYIASECIATKLKELHTKINKLEAELNKKITENNEMIQVLANYYARRQGLEEGFNLWWGYKISKHGIWKDPSSTIAGEYELEEARKEREKDLNCDVCNECGSRISKKKQ